jgi:hypothetical protein
MRAIVVALALAAFVLPAVTIEFFHTEDNPCRSDDCPACQFHQATAAIASAPVAVLPDLSFVEALPPPTKKQVAEPHVVERSSRAPPSA